MFGRHMPVPAYRALFVLAAFTICACGGPERSLKHGSRITALAISHDGLRLASGGADGHVKVWQTATGALIHDLAAGQEGILEVAFSPDGEKLGAAHGDQLSRWEVAGGKLERQVPLESLTAAIAATRRPIVFAFVLDLDDGRDFDGLWELMLAWRGAGLTALVSPDGKWIACEGSEVGSAFIEVADTRSKRVTGRLSVDLGQAAAIRAASALRLGAAVAMTSDGRLLTFERRDGKPGEQITDTDRAPDAVLTLWDPATGRDVWKLPFRMAAVYHGWIGVPGPPPQSADGRLVVASVVRSVGRRPRLAALTRRFGLLIRGRAYVEETAIIVVLDGVSGKEVRTLGKHPGKDASLAVAPDGSVAATGGDDGRVRVWPLR